MSRLIARAAQSISLLLLITIPSGCLELSDNAAEKRYYEQLEQGCFLQYITMPDSEKADILTRCILISILKDQDNNNNDSNAQMM